MASFRIPAIRHLVSRPLTTPRIARRWAAVHDVRFLATHGAQERVLAKYKEKLDRKAKEEGLKDVGELKQAYKEKITQLRNEATVPGANAPLEPQAATATTANAFTPPPPPPPPTPTAAASGIPTPPPSPTQDGEKPPPGVKTLSSFLDVPKTRELPPKEIEYIWRLRHAQNPQSLCALLPAGTWNTIARTARQHPQFVLPLPREGQGAELHFLQWTFPTAASATVLFTSLAEYKLRAEFSSPHTTVTFHTDLASAKDVVLVQGEVVPDRGVAVDQGKWLLMCLQKFYGLQAEEQGGARKRLLEMFSNGDAGFKVEELLEEAEKI